MASHGHAGRGGRTKTYNSWLAARNRCNNPKHPWYENYGGRGITVCPRWEKSFQAFLKDMGECPSGHSLERLDSGKGYFPGNCVWGSQEDQNKTQRSAKVLTAPDGTSKTLGGWARKLGINRTTLSRWLARGWAIEDLVPRERTWCIHCEGRADCPTCRGGDEPACPTCSGSGLCPAC